VKENDFKGIDSDSLTVLKVVFYLMMTSSWGMKDYIFWQCIPTRKTWEKWL